MQMAAMGRVERAAEEPDAAMPAVQRSALGASLLPAVLGAVLVRAGQGRTWPLPRTRYL
jgi:hypothetical protein